jgi:hypothetical protein
MLDCFEGEVSLNFGFNEDLNCSEFPNENYRAWSHPFSAQGR